MDLFKPNIVHGIRFQSTNKIGQPNRNHLALSLGIIKNEIAIVTNVIQCAIKFDIENPFQQRQGTRKW